jgi:hypothetical protein
MKLQITTAPSLEYAIETLKSAGKPFEVVGPTCGIYSTGEVTINNPFNSNHILTLYFSTNGFVWHEMRAYGCGLNEKLFYRSSYSQHTGHTSRKPLTQIYRALKIK